MNKKITILCCILFFAFITAFAFQPNESYLPVAACKPISRTVVQYSTSDNKVQSANENKTPANNNLTLASERKVAVNGKGGISVVPDEVTFNVAIETSATDILDARNENIEKFNAIKEVLKKYNIDEKNIKTSGYYVYKDYTYNQNEKKFEGYVINNSICIKLGDLKVLGNVLDELVEGGINIVNNITFSYSDYDALYKQALNLAMESAKEKASIIAGTDNLSVFEICEEGCYCNPPILYSNYETVKSASGSTSMFGGEVKICASVKVVYNF